jgi:sn-glycerol 3-phosphate transport system permease protein
LPFAAADTQWNLVMATTILALIPPVVAVAMQKLFAKVVR